MLENKRNGWMVVAALLIGLLIGSLSSGIYEIEVTKPVAYRINKWTGDVRFYRGDTWVECKEKAPKTITPSVDVDELERKIQNLRFEDIQNSKE